MENQNKDLELLDQVEFKFALAETEEQFQRLIDQFLAPLIRKASSQEEIIRDKVLSVLNHVIKRINTGQNIIIPGIELASLTQEPNILVQNIALKLLENGFQKLTTEDQARIVIYLVKNIHVRSSPTQVNSMIKLIILLISNAIELPNLREVAEFNIYQSTKQEDFDFLCKKLCTFMLKGWGGLSESPLPLNFNVKDLQLNVLKYLERPINNTPKWPLNIYKVFLSAGAANYRDIAEKADTSLKRVEKPNLESSKVASDLMSMYLDKDANLSLKIKLIEMLQRSMISTTIFPKCMQVIFDGLHGDHKNNKLRLRALNYTQWTLRNGDLNIIAKICPVFLNGIMKLINFDPEDLDRDLLNVIGAAYITISLLSIKAPVYFMEDFTVITRFFKDLKFSHIIPQIKESLNTMIEVYNKPIFYQNEEKLSALLAIIEQNFNSINPASRVCAMRYIVSVFPRSHIYSRFLCIVGMGDEENAVVELANEGLQIDFSSSSIEELPLPFELIQFSANYIEHNPKFIKPFLPNDNSSLVLGFPQTIVKFILLYFWSLISSTTLNDLLLNLSTDPEHEATVRERFSTLLKEEINKDNQGSLLSERISIIINFIKSSFNKSLQLSDELLLIAAHIFSQIVACSSKELLDSLYLDIKWIESNMTHSKPYISECMARSYAIIVINSINEDNSNPINLISDVLYKHLQILNSEKVTDIKVNQSLVILGFLISRYSYRFPNHCDLPLVNQCIDKIYGFGDSKSLSIQETFLLTVRECGRYVPLFRTIKDSSTEVTQEEPLIFKRIYKIIKTTTNTKIAESALLTLGHLGVGDHYIQGTLLKALTNLPYPLNKNLEVFFRAGEAIACLAGKWRCSLVYPSLDVPPNLPPKFTDESYSEGVEASLVENIVKYLEVSSKADQPNIRKGSVFCLLAIIKFCHKDIGFRSYFPLFHNIFMNLLTDKDEIIQEIASTGMGLVYEYSDEETKSHFVSCLLTVFGKGRSLKESMGSNNSVIFTPEDGLGPAPDGTQINTYQSIMSLAADMNQPDLIYQFLSLARNNAIWNSRKGAAFGLSQLFIRAKSHIMPHLPDFLPKLYLFLFDTDPKVVQIMSKIWKTLIQDEDAGLLLDQYFDIIAESLLKGMGDKSWRIRQSSCAALSDLIHGRNVNISNYMERIWMMNFRCLDDIKESTRVVGLRSCNSALNVTIKFIEENNSNFGKGEAIIKVVLPFLIEKGIHSDAEDVRVFSLSSLLKITEKADKLLLPYLPELIPTFLDALTSLEPEAINYLSFHVSSYNTTQEELDSQRLSFIKQSSISNSLVKCVKLLDETTLNALIPSLIHKIRRSIGFATKAGCAKLVADLINEKKDLVSPHSKPLLKAIISGLSDKSTVIQKLWASTIGLVSQVAEAKTIDEILENQKEEYIKSQDEKKRLVCSMTCLEISKRSPKIFASIKENMLPVAYFGSFDRDNTISKNWTEIWGDHTPGTTAALIAYDTIIIKFLITMLDSNSWDTKKQAAKALANVAMLMGPKFELWISLCLEVVLNHLNGRTWSGKEHLLIALEQIILSNPTIIKTNSNYLDLIQQALLRDIQKKNLAFKTRAIQVSAKIIITLELNCFYLIKDILLDIIQDNITNSSYIDDDTDENVMKPRLLLLKSYSINCLISALPKDLNNINDELFNIIKILSNLHHEPWNIRSTVLDSFHIIINGLKKLEIQIDLNEFERIYFKFWSPIFEFLEASLKDSKFSGIRISAMERLIELNEFKLVQQSSYFKEEIYKLLDLASKDSLPVIYEKANELKLII